MSYLYRIRQVWENCYAKDWELVFVNLENCGEGGLESTLLFPQEIKSGISFGN